MPAERVTAAAATASRAAFAAASAFAARWLAPYARAPATTAAVAAKAIDVVVEDMVVENWRGVDQLQRELTKSADGAELDSRSGGVAKQTARGVCACAGLAADE